MCRTSPSTVSSVVRSKSAAVVSVAARSPAHHGHASACLTFQHDPGVALAELGLAQVLDADADPHLPRQHRHRADVEVGLRFRRQVEIVGHVFEQIVERSRHRTIDSAVPPRTSFSVDARTMLLAERLPERGAELVERKRAQTDTCRPFFLSDRRSSPVRGKGPHFTDIASGNSSSPGQAWSERTPWSRRATAGPSGRGSVGARFVGHVPDEAERGAGGQAGRIPPGGRRIVGDRDERAAHALRASADELRNICAAAGGAHTTTTAAASRPRTTIVMQTVSVGRYTRVIRFVATRLRT